MSCSKHITKLLAFFCFCGFLKTKMDGTDTLSAKVVCERLKAQRAASRKTAPYVRIPSSDAVAHALQTLHECKCVLESLNPTQCTGTKSAHSSWRSSCDWRSDCATSPRTSSATCGTSTSCTRRSSA